MKMDKSGFYSCRGLGPATKNVNASYLNDSTITDSIKQLNQGKRRAAFTMTLFPPLALSFSYKNKKCKYFRPYLNNTKGAERNSIILLSK